MDKPRSGYSVVQRVPSCALTPQVLADLERRILSHIEGLPDISTVHTAIAIQDRVGTETLSTMGDYPYSFLPPNTKSADITVRAHPPYGERTRWENASVSLSFGSEPLDSRLRIDFVGENSRQVVMAILDDIDRCMAPYKTQRAWLHFPQVFIWLIPSWLLVGTYAVLGRSRGWPLSSYASAVAVIGGWLWFVPLLLASRFLPYTQFRSDEGKRGAVLGTLALSVVASLLAAYLYQVLKGH